MKKLDILQIVFILTMAVLACLLAEYLYPTKNKVVEEYTVTFSTKAFVSFQCLEGYTLNVKKEDWSTKNNIKVTCDQNSSKLILK